MKLEKRFFESSKVTVLSDRDGRDRLRILSNLSVNVPSSTIKTYQIEVQFRTRTNTAFRSSDFTG